MSPAQRIGMIALLACGNAAALEPDVVFERAAPSVWAVWGTGPSGKPGPLASGVVTGEGKVTTNCHVVTRAKNLQVRKDSASFDATLEFADTRRDLCQLDVRGLSAPAATPGSAKGLRVGQRVFSINSPRGQELALGEGIVSSVRGADDGSPTIQTTVGLSRGSSGGGLFDAEARLVGITTFQASEGPTANFAQPVEWIAAIAERSRATPAAPAATAAVASAVPAAATGTAPAAAPAANVIAGEELSAHFRKAQRIELISSGDILALTFRPTANTFRMTYRTIRMPSGYPVDGSYAVNNDQVCFRLPDAAPKVGYQVDGWDWMSACFRLSRDDDRNYVLKAVRGNAYIVYALR